LPTGNSGVDGFGREHYPNGARLTSDLGEVHYPNGSRVRNSARELLVPNGTTTRSSWGEVRYPNGQRTRDAFGKCYHETGVEMTPCRRSVEIRDRLAGGGTAFSTLDLESGALDLERIRFEFPSAALPAPRPVATRSYLVSLTADLARGRPDRASIAATCGP
jgi:hypothetical protein